MAKGKIPAALKAHQFKKGSAKAKTAGKKGGKVTPAKSGMSKSAKGKGKG